MIRVPNRDVLALIAHGDQRAIRFLEELTAAVNGSASGSHTHPLSQLEESGAALGQFPEWNGSAWVPAYPATGWGAYVHTGAIQSIVANVKATVNNNAGAVLEMHKPADIATFYDGAVIPGRNGDGAVIGVEVTFTPTTGGSSALVVSIDIGGAVGELYAQEYPVLKGLGIAHKISYTAAVYMLDTWEANGGAVKIVCDGPGDLTAVRYVIQRLHKALP